MTILQALAADLIGVEIVFWAFDPSGLQTARDAHQIYLRKRGKSASVSSLLHDLLQRRFKWGKSDGN
jgi:hypothetical protein